LTLFLRVPLFLFLGYSVFKGQYYWYCCHILSLPCGRDKGNYRQVSTLCQGLLKIIFNIFYRCKKAACAAFFGV
jgi:predicted nucleic acid-binding Zn finger protein